METIPEARCPVNYPDGRTCNLQTVTVDHFLWGDTHVEVERCPRGHETEWAAHPDEQG